MSQAKLSKFRIVHFILEHPLVNGTQCKFHARNKRFRIHDLAFLVHETGDPKCHFLFFQISSKLQTHREESSGIKNGEGKCQLLFLLVTTTQFILVQLNVSSHWKFQMNKMIRRSTQPSDSSCTSSFYRIISYNFVDGTKVNYLFLFSRHFVPVQFSVHPCTQ